MSSFNRKVNRQKNTYVFSEKKEVKPKINYLAEALNFKWITKDWKTIVIVVLEFLLVGNIFVPILYNFINGKIAFVLANGLITPLLMVITNYFFEKPRPEVKVLISRYIVLGIIFAVISYISAMIVL